MGLVTMLQRRDGQQEKVTDKETSRRVPCRPRRGSDWDTYNGKRITAHL